MPPVDVKIESNKRRSASGEGILKFPEQMGAHGILFIFKQYKYEQTRGLLNSSSVIGESILLPFPKQLVDRTGVRLNNRVELGLSGEAAAVTMSNGGGTFSAMQSAASSLIPGGDTVANAISGLINGNQQTITALAQQSNFLLRRTLDQFGGAISQGVDIGSGTTVNPKAALSFEGVDMKTHNFDWDLAPTTPTESIVINKIVNTIKKNMLPSYRNLQIGGEDILQRIFLKYPSMVDIYLIGVDSNHFLKYKTGMVHSLDINYSPSGSVPILRGGKPAIVSMQMSIYEADIHTSVDYGGSDDTGFENNLKASQE